MRLREIAEKNLFVNLVDIGGFADLVREVQTKLGEMGLLDPPADGAFGPVSRWALREAGRAFHLGDAGGAGIDRELAAKLADVASGNSPLALAPGDDFAGRIVAKAIDDGYWVCRHPDCFNIVYVEGADLEGVANGNPPNRFNDVRALIRIDQPSGVPRFAGAWEATSEPGKFYVQNPLPGVGAAARISLGQWKAWAVGVHNGDHEALVQVAPITVYRDFNRDYSRVGDPPDTGMFGINQHWGYDLPATDIRNASAGCLVGRLTSGHKAFMKLVKTDARYVQNHGYRFMTTILSRDAF